MKHLTGVTYWYLVGSFDLATDEFVWDWDDEEVWYGGDMWAYPHESPAAILASYRQACDFGLAAIDQLDLDAVGAHHTGHADIVREHIDDAVGVHAVLSNTVDGNDDEYWATYRQRIDGTLNREEWLAYNKARG